MFLNVVITREIWVRRIRDFFVRANLLELRITAPVLYAS